MAHDSYFVMFVFPLMLLDMVVQFMSIQIYASMIANGEQRWRHTIFHSIPFRSRQIENTATESKARRWNNNFEARINIGAYGSGLSYLHEHSIFVPSTIAASDVRVRFTNSILLYHSISVHASSSLFSFLLLLLFFAQNFLLVFLLFVLLCSLCIAMLVGMNEASIVFRL